MFGVYSNGVGAGQSNPPPGPRWAAQRHPREKGQNPLPWPRPDELPGPLCYCGKRGCIETFLSGPGFAAHDQSSRGRRSAPEIVAAARAGEVRAIKSLDLYLDRLARALATVINMLDPDVIVLGGGMSNVEEVYQECRRSGEA